MKKILSVILLIIAVTAGFPFLIVENYSGNEAIIKKNENNEEKNHETVSVYVASEDAVREMDQDQYIKEVVSAEMPAEFDAEALKAQAVAARTYMVNRIKAYSSSKIPEVHKGAYLCTDPSHCKAWISEEERKKLWGADKADEYWKKISDAVDETEGLIITYNKEPISAVFHSTSSGYTESAKDVWGGDAAYLVSVKSEGDKNSPKYNDEVTFPTDEFKRIAEEKIDGTDPQKPLIGKIERSEAGGIISIEILGKRIKGTEFRALYGLRSTNAAINTDDKNVIIDTKGYGHGVGMSQYGANYLANQGKDFKEILKTYYTGTEISEYDSIYPSF